MTSQTMEKSTTYSPENVCLEVTLTASLASLCSRSGHLPLRDPVHPHAARLVRPPVARVVAEAERGGNLRH